MNTNHEAITEETAVKVKFPRLPLILTIIFAAGFFLVGGLRFLIMTVLNFLCGSLIKSERENNIREGRKAGSPGAAGIVTLILFNFAAVLFTGFLLFPPIYISSHLKWKYPFQKSYIGLYQNIQEPDWFPDFMGDVREDYRFEYMPSILQGDGHYSVRFVTDRETAEKYAAKFAETAVYTVRLGAAYSDGSFLVENETPETYDDYLEIQKDDGFWIGASPLATAYVLNAYCNWNHPSASAVIVDPVTGKIELSMM